MNGAGVAGGRFRGETAKRGVALSILLSLFAKGLAFSIQLSIIYFFGARGTTDVFFWCLNLVVAVSGLVACLNSTVVIPHGMHLLNGEGEGAMHGFLRTVIRRYLAISVAAALVMAVFPAEIASRLSKLDAQTIAQNAGTIRILCLSLPAVVLTYIFADIMAMRKLFSVSIAIEAAKSLANLAIFLGLRPWLGKEAMAWGFLMGSLIQGGLLAWVLGSSMRWSFAKAGSGLPRRVKVDMLYALTGQSAAFGYTLFSAYLISGFAAGVYSSMNCAQSLINPIQMIFLAKVSYVVGMYFMDLYWQGRTEALNAMFQKYLRPVLLGLLMLVPVMFYFGEEIISLFFQRGGFRRADARIAAEFFALFSLGLPFQFVDSIATQLILAAKKVRTGIFLQIGNSIANVVAVWILVGRMGYVGYPAALLLVRSLYLLVLWAYMRRTFAFLDFGGSLGFLARNLATIGIGAALLYPLRSSGPWFHVLLPSVILAGAFLWPENRGLIAGFAFLLRRKLVPAWRP